MNRTGWLCPRCNKVNSPDVMKCDCVPDLVPQLPNIFDFWINCQCAFPSANCQKSDCPRRLLTWSSTNAS